MASQSMSVYGSVVLMVMAVLPMVTLPEPYTRSRGLLGNRVGFVMLPEEAVSVVTLSPLVR